MFSTNMTISNKALKKPQSCEEMGCHHDCQTTNNGPLCTCRHGYKLNRSDDKTCDGKYE